MAGLFLVGLAVFAFWHKQNPTFAYITLEEEIQGDEICDLPIPLDMPLQSAVELVDKVFQQYKQAAYYVQQAVSGLQAVVAGLSSDTVCDFSKCRSLPANNDLSQTTNIAPDLDLNINTLIGPEYKGVGIRIPLCLDTEECVGDPCALSEINKAKNELISLQAALKGSYTAINKLFTTANQPINYDTAKPSEIKSDMSVDKNVTPQEMVERETESAIMWLEFCSLTTKEKTAKDEGASIRREPTRCFEAIEQNIYWPRPWSEKCQQECPVGVATKECIDCLAKCAGTSVLSRINCRVYNPKENDIKCQPVNMIKKPFTPSAPANIDEAKEWLAQTEQEANAYDMAWQKCCGLVCSNGMNEKCGECICSGMSREECRAWLCGGSDRNFVCCHK